MDRYCDQQFGGLIDIFGYRIGSFSIVIILRVWNMSLDSFVLDKDLCVGFLLGRFYIRSLKVGVV